MDSGKLPPVHPGEILNEEFLIPLGISQDELADSIGVDAGRIHGIVRGDMAISAETVSVFRYVSAVLDGASG